MRVVRVYHAGRSAGHRARERALVAAGAEVLLVVPANWSEGGAEARLGSEPFPVKELVVHRPDDVNRHRYLDGRTLGSVIRDFQPDVIDVHEEPLSAVMRQVLAVTPPDVPVVGYTAQNVNKRYPPPFPSRERAAFGRLSALYPCSRQAAAVARERGFRHTIEVLPLGYDPQLFKEGAQQHGDRLFRLALVGRLVEEKGVREAIIAAAAVKRVRPVELVIAGSGPFSGQVEALLAEYGLQGDVRVLPWVSAADVAEIYRRSHVVLVPSKATHRWVEQFGRMIVEGQACGAVVGGYASGSINEVTRGAGLLNAEGDLAGFTSGLRDLATMPDFWLALRRRGLENSAERSWEKVAAAQVGLYSRLLSGRVADDGDDFGGTALLQGSVRRPFAVPVLREMPSVARLLERHPR